MSYRLLIFSLALWLCSFCKSPESSKKASANTSTPSTKMQINQPIIEDNTVIRATIFNHGEDRGVTLAPEQTDTIAAICMQLLTESEPMRIALDGEEMAQLKINASGFELIFLPPLNTSSADSTGLGKMLFLRSGNFSTSDLSADARFFIALAHDKQYISSPYFAEAAADKVKILDQILKNTN